MNLTSRRRRRFWAKVAVAGRDDCWEWQGHLNHKGYGHTQVNYTYYRCHRFAWELAHRRPVPGGLCVCHSCDNRRCCNPRHLWVGTINDNNQDMKRKGRDNPGGGKRPGKLTRERVQRIRNAYSAGGVSMKSLADEFGVSGTAIWKVVHGQIKGCQDGIS